MDDHKPPNKAELLAFLHQESMKVKGKTVEVMEAETDNPYSLRSSERLNALKGSFLCCNREKCCQCLQKKPPKNKPTNRKTSGQQFLFQMHDIIDSLIIDFFLSLSRADMKRILAFIVEHDVCACPVVYGGLKCS